MNKESFLNKLADHILNQYDLSKQDLTVVFPNKRAAYYLRNEIKEKGKQTLWLPQMLSIEEAVTQWSGIGLADSIDLLFELIDIDAQLHEAQNDDLNIFGSQAAQMAKDFDEIDQYGVDAERIFNYVVENKKLEYWNLDENKAKEKELKYLQFFHSLYHYYRCLRERLAKQGKGYYGMITRYLAELKEDELLKRLGDGKVVFAGFNAMTKTEEQVVDTLIKNGKAEILFDYDSYYLDDYNHDGFLNEAGYFGRRFKKIHPDWLKDGVSSALQTEEKHINIISINGNALQTKALQANLQTIQDKKQAVVLADQRLLIPTLNAIPDVEEYKDFSVSMGYPIGMTPVNHLIKEYFALCRLTRIKRTRTIDGIEHTIEGWYLWPILRLMELEIVKIVFPKEEIAAFSRWRIKMVGNSKFIFEDTDIEELKHMPNIQAFLKLVLPKENPRSPSVVLHSIYDILAFLAKLTLEKDAEKKASFLLNQISEIGKIVNRLQQIITRNSKYVNDTQSIEILYRLLTAGASLKLSSSSTEGLQIMGLLETRNLSFDEVHLLSVNEGILPPDKSQGSFIPHFIRREYGLPSYTESQAVVAYHFYRLLQNGKNIYLYYNNLGESSGGEASRFILQIKYELSKLANIHIEEKQFSSNTSPSIEVKELKAQKDQETMDRLHYLIEDEAKGLSPSSLSTYLNCPLQFYLKYIVQIKDNSTDEEVGSNNIGTIIHDTLEFLFADYLPKDGTLLTINKTLFDLKIKPLWKEKLALAVEKSMPNGFPDVGFNYLNRVTIEQQLENYLNYTSEQLKNADLIILKTEGELHATPFGKCRISGRADRIDRFGGVVRVIDYKTGHVEASNLRLPVRHHDESNLDYLRQIPEKALQLLLYKYMYLKENAGVSPEQVEGSIHGLRHANSIEFKLNKVQPKKDGSDAVANFLDNSNFISDMEAMLKAVVSEMLDRNVPFKQVEDSKKCGYCDFKLICKR